LTAYESSIINFEEFIRETQMQFYVDSATTSLPTYENEYGLQQNPSLPDSQRRSRIKAKMRSAGTSTKAMIQNTIEAWSNADIEIYEDYGNYQIQVTFTNAIGIPPNMTDVYAAVREIIPAHLGIVYIFKYRRHEELKPFTHAQLAVFTHDTIREGAI
jgi:PKD repeat protein